MMVSKINPAKTVAEVVDALSDRLKDVITKRYGLKDGQRRTLEAIGREFGITRERVRQIEAEAFRQLKGKEFFQKLEPLCALFRSHLEAHGKIRKETTLLEADLEAHLGIPATPQQRAAVRFVLALAEDHFTRVGETKQFDAIWTTEPQLVSALPKITASIESYFKKQGTVSTYAEAKTAATQALAAHLGGAPSVKVVHSYLGAARNIGKNVFGQFGLSHWPEISPRGIKDKAYLVLKEANNPLHFREVAERITKASFSNRKAHVQTVHNELIKDNRFILVGRGTYALKEWGFQPGTVRDVLMGVLKQAGRPLNKEEILEQILKQRQVKANTVFLNLQNKAYFAKTKEGKFVIKA